MIAPDLFAEICRRVGDGETLRKILAEDGKPSPGTFYAELQQNDAAAEQYARAKSLQMEAFADEIIEISDDGARDYVKGPDGREVPDHDHIQRSRLRVDSRKWLMSKLAPKKYGERIEQTLQGAVKLVIEQTDADL